MVMAEAAQAVTVDAKLKKPGVPKGHKQTEVGMIPNDWSVDKLDNICNQICDGTHYTPKYVDHGIPFYSVENVTENNFTQTKRISFEEHVKLIRRCKPERGDILMTRIGSIGETKLIDWDVNASIYVSLALLKPGTLVSPRYLYAYSKSDIFVNDVEKRALLNAVPKKINMGDIGGILISFPQSIAEQEAIAEALDDADALIESLEQLIEKKRRIKQGAMQELLSGRRRLPGFSGEWRTVPLGQLAEIGTGSRNNQDKELNGRYPFFVRSRHVERINSYSFDTEAILIPGEGGIGDIFHYINGKFDVHQRVYAIRNFVESACAKFIYYYMKMYFGAHAMKNTVKATVDSLRLPTFLAFEVVLPPTTEEQAAISDALSDLESEIETLESRLEKARQIKQGMMQELLTGRIRLV